MDMAAVVVGVHNMHVNMYRDLDRNMQSAGVQNVVDRT